MNRSGHPAQSVKDGSASQCSVGRRRRLRWVRWQREYDLDRIHKTHGVGTAHPTELIGGLRMLNRQAARVVVRMLGLVYGLWAVGAASRRSDG